MIRKETLRSLEFDKILDSISRFSHSEVSKEYILKICPFNNRKDIEKRFGLIKEILSLSYEKKSLSLSDFKDISDLIEKIRPVDAVLDPVDLAAFIPLLRIMNDISLQLKNNKSIPLLKELASPLTGFPEIQEIMERSIDTDGNILDTASPTLAHYRKQIKSLEGRIKKRLENIIRDKKISPFIQDVFITKRTGRWVVPIRMDSKGQIPGVVHDVSRSGETAFIEPLEIIGLANELENLSAEEKVEEMRILRQICQMLREILDDFIVQYKIIIYLDVLQSIASFVNFMNLNIPQINEDTEIRLINARHPLLILLKREGLIKEVVPIDLQIGGENTLMVITGPNAGGKTITIKTVGLLLLMALSGIPVSADSSSSFPLIHNLLIDIGDEQSIENSLSTFSAHITNIREILENADSKTVVLIDELGTGTEPNQGSAISCAVLNSLKEKGTLVFATTHLTEIVAFVYKTKGMVNASMEFDQKTLTPLYKLRFGDPGQSYSLEIAKRYGLPVDIIDFARKMLGNIGMEFHDLLEELKEKRLRYENTLREVEKKKIIVEENERILKDKLAQVEVERKEILKRAYKEAQDIIILTKRQMNEFLQEMKKERKLNAKRKVDKIYAEIEDKIRGFTKEPLISIEEIKEGDIVFIKSFGYNAIVDRIDRIHNKLWVNAGNMDIELPVSDISYSRGNLSGQSFVKQEIEEREDLNVPYELNIIGLRVDEAISKVEQFLNHASLVNHKEVTIIHGVGTGALMKAVHQHLNGHALVEKFRSGDQFKGGRGVTIVNIR